MAGDCRGLAGHCASGGEEVRDHTEDGSIEGILTKDGLADSVTGAVVPCMYKAPARYCFGEYIGKRVLAAGTIAYVGGRQAHILVRELRELGLCKVSMADLHGIDITGGMDPVDYVRAMRDAE